jgi:hypothetical protein
MFSAISELGASPILRREAAGKRAGAFRWESGWLTDQNPRGVQRTSHVDYYDRRYPDGGETIDEVKKAIDAGGMS